ncbi:MAG TPA: RpiB/LacA/LacB family sugar-phosphate isomerase [Gemmatimonadaceae bacterium]
MAFGCDHAGWPLRGPILDELRSKGFEIVDCGSVEPVPGDDYPDVSAAVGRAVASGQAERGVLVCGSGVGASIAASKLTGVRCALCHDPFSAHQGVEDDNMNVIALGARVIGPELAIELVRDFLGARFSGLERHRRRLEKIAALERSRS